MALDRTILRDLAAWDTGGMPVTSMYLDTDGRRYPRRAAILHRAQDLLRNARAEGERRVERSVLRDVERIQMYLQEGFERSGTAGVAAFSCAERDLWTAVPLGWSVRDRVVVAPRPHLLPLEALLEMAETFCTAVVDREKARLLLSSLGEIEEVSEILDEVPGRHDQGGWAQARLQRHIEDHVHRHLKNVAEALLRLLKREDFDHLVLAGPEETVAELERELHDYVRRTIVGRISVPMTAGAAEILDRTMEVAGNLERRREEEAVARLKAGVAAGGKAVAGLPDTIDALEAGRVETLVVAADLRAGGVRCPSCGHVDTSGTTVCPACGSRVEERPDVVEEAVESALRQRCRVETVSDGPSLESLGGIGALLRF